MKLTLPIPPSANRYWRNFRGRVVVSSEAKEYKSLAFYLAREQAGEEEAFTVPVKITSRFYFAANRGDMPNYTKVLYDALEGIAFINDKLIFEEHNFRLLDKRNPRVEIEIIPLELQLL